MVRGQRVGYIRVSSVGQNPGRQLDGVEVGRVFTDTASGKSTTRPQLQAMLAYVRDGDTVIVHSMDRLARNLDDLRRHPRAAVGRDPDHHLRVLLVLTQVPADQLMQPGHAGHALRQPLLGCRARRVA